MSADPLPHIKRRLEEWRARPDYSGNMAHGLDRMAAWVFTSEDDIEWLVTEVEELRKKVRMYEVVKS